MSETPEDMLKLADAALLEAKRRGRDRSVYVDSYGELREAEAAAGEAGTGDALLNTPLPTGGDTKNFRVMVINDQDAVRKLLKTMLESWGYTVQDFATPREALVELEINEYDLVLTDLHLPELSGLDVVRRVKKLNTTLPVIVFTGYGTIQTAVEAIRLGAEDYILKPLTMELLKQAVEKATAKRIQHLRKLEDARENIVDHEQKTSFRNAMDKSSAELTLQAHELRILEEFNRRSLEHVASALILLDHDGRIIHFNRRALEILHLSENAAVNSKLFESVPSLRESPLAEGFDLVRETGGKFERHDIWLDPGAGLPRSLVNIYIFPFLPEVREVRRYLVTIEDLYDQKVIEDQHKLFLQRFGDRLDKRILDIMAEFRRILEPLDLPPEEHRRLLELVQEIHRLTTDLKQRGTLQL